MAPKKRPPTAPAAAAPASPSAATPGEASVVRLARVVAPPPKLARTLPQSISGFAADARASLETLRASVSDDAARDLLRDHPGLAWDDAVIHTAEVAIERAMRDAPSARGLALAAPADDDDDPPSRSADPPLALPAPAPATGAKRRRTARGEPPPREPRTARDRANGEGSGAAATPSPSSERALALVADPLPADPLPADPLPTDVSAALARAGAIALVESRAPLRCLRSRDAAVSRPHGGYGARRRRFKSAEDEHEIFVPASDASPPASAGEEGSITPGVDALVRVGVHNPSNAAQVAEEFLCLQSTSLAALKDAATRSCRSNAQVAEAGLPRGNTNGFIFCEGVFYNDLRGGSGAGAGAETHRVVDYSAPIIAFQKAQERSRRWVAAPGGRDRVLEASHDARASAVADALRRGERAADARRIGDEAAREAAREAAARAPPAFEARDAAGVTVGDLVASAFKTYALCHHGDCEHALTIRGARLAHADDPRERGAYPLKVFEARRFRRRCSMCDVFEARRVTWGDKLAPCSPCFFCAECFDALHLDEKGNPAYEGYEVYDYHHE